MAGNNCSAGCFGLLFRAVCILALVFVLLMLALVINQKIALARARARFPAPGMLVEVEGHLMHIHCLGSGSPTVVIDAGNGSFSAEWAPIQEALSQTARVCTYDRSGYGWSEPGPLPRSGAQVVSELHQLLQDAGEVGPYLLVGHSLGGVHARLFAAQYPKEVAGMVLIDTAYPLTITPEYEKQIRTTNGFYQVMKLLTGSGLLRILGPLGGEESMPATARKLRPDLQPAYLENLLDPSQYTTAIAEMQQIRKLSGKRARSWMGIILLATSH